MIFKQGIVPKPPNILSLLLKILKACDMSKKKLHVAFVSRYQRISIKLVDFSHNALFPLSATTT